MAVTATKKAAAAKTAATKTAKPDAASLEGAEQSAPTPGATAAADSGGAVASGDAGSAGPADAEQAAKLLADQQTADALALATAWDEALLEEEQRNAVALAAAEEQAHQENEQRNADAQALASAWDEAQQEDALRSEGKAWDQAIAEDAQRLQTGAEKGDSRAVTLTGWALPEISEFPATVTLENNTPSRFGVAGANVEVAAYGRVTVEVDQGQFAKLQKALTSSARAHKWDNLKGLQVKYDSKD